MKYVEELTGKIDLSNSKKYEEVKKGYTYFANEDIIFAKITPCMENGKIAITRNLLNGIGFGSTEFHVIRLLHKDMLREFYFWYLMQDGFRNNAQYNMKGTAGQLRVPVSFIEESVVPVPPLNEQKRIVSKIEELFSILDEVEKTAIMLQTKLRQLGQSILVHSIPEIFFEFLEKTSFDISNFDSFKKQYEEKLPKSWNWKEMWEMCTIVTDGSHLTPTRLESGKIMLSAKNVRNGFLSLDNVSYVSERDFIRETKRCFPQKNDILIVSVGATIGRAAIVRNETTFYDC